MSKCTLQGVRNSNQVSSLLRLKLEFKDGTFKIDRVKNKVVLLVIFCSIKRKLLIILPTTNYSSKRFNSYVVLLILKTYCNYKLHNKFYSLRSRHCRENYHLYLRSCDAYVLPSNNRTYYFKIR